jgi:L-ascorbate metabolism protein UlaG (beta-lactamase superfamily)
MKIEWVNHASYVLSSKGVNLICDPWLSGSAFNQGWSLLSSSKFRVEDFDRITHVWFSQEHSDHFSPPSLPLEREAS